MFGLQYGAQSGEYTVLVVEVSAMSIACVWTCVVLLATTPGIVLKVVFASQAFIVDTPNGTVHVDPSGLTVSTADNPTGEY